MMAAEVKTPINVSSDKGANGYRVQEHSPTYTISGNLEILTKMLKSVVGSFRFLFSLWNKAEPKIRKKRALILSLIVLHILPIWIFRYFPSAEVEVLPIIFMLIYKLKVKKLGILYINDKHGTSVFELLKDRFEKSGGTVRGEDFGQNEYNFRERIARLKDMEAIYTVGFAKHLGEVFRQLKEEDFRGFILGPAEILNVVKTTPEMNNAYTAAPIVYNPDYLRAKEAKQKYEARYNKPFTHQAANGYDFVKLLAGLLEDKEVSRESMRSLLEEGFIYPGVFGDLDVKPGQHDIDFPLHPAQIVEGEVKYLQ